LAFVGITTLQPWVKRLSRWQAGKLSDRVTAAHARGIGLKQEKLSLRTGEVPNSYRLFSDFAYRQVKSRRPYGR